MNFSTRLKGAYALIFGRGDNGAVCSFCGCNRRSVEIIVTGPAATAICNRCNILCTQVMLENNVPRFARFADLPHERTFIIELSHWAPLLGEAERVSLEQLLRRLVRDLPQTRLVGWSFMHSEGRFDLLSIQVTTTSPIPHREISNMAVVSWRQMRDRFVAALKTPANLSEPPMIEVAAAAANAAAAYAEAIFEPEPVEPVISETDVDKAPDATADAASGDIPSEADQP